MSAFQVCSTHIDVLVSARRMGHFPMSTARDLSDDQLGRMLVATNHESVYARYREDVVAPGYKFHQTAVSALMVLKAIDCYEYQSCEHDGWETSTAKAYCEGLRRYVIGCLPGYDDAPWEVKPEDFGRTAPVRKAVSR
jgi:hypothetical protein